MIRVIWIDLIIIFLLIVSLLWGINIGLIRSIIQIMSIWISLMVSCKYYARGANLLIQWLAIPNDYADLITLFAIFVFANALLLSIGRVLSSITRYRVIRSLDRIGGSLTGLLIGIFIVGILLILVTSFPLTPEFKLEISLDQSVLAPRILHLTERLYDRTKSLLPTNFPNLAFLPEQPAGTDSGALSGEIKLINFSRLDQSTCISCHGQVDFLGYFKNQHGTTSPKFICQNCGRTSDGCQTFEGYHQMYGQCPAELGNRGYRFDCGIWSNGQFVRPTGTCPVCAFSADTSYEFIPNLKTRYIAPATITATIIANKIT
ncbi:MAG TPA: CvpA family protein [Firmicutes bacterium]|nr:CvpA family protein [Bacillota bacterium]